MSKHHLNNIFHFTHLSIWKCKIFFQLFFFYQIVLWSYNSVFWNDSITNFPANGIFLLVEIPLYNYIFINRRKVVIIFCLSSFPFFQFFFTCLDDGYVTPWITWEAEWARKGMWWLKYWCWISEGAERKWGMFN